MSAPEHSAPLGLGILGLGGAAVNMMPAFRRSPYFEVKAVADIDEDVLRRFKEDHEEALTYADIEGLSGDPAIDLIYIGTPNHIHSEHARIALEHGKHVLIEKPMAVTLEDADEMIATAAANGVLLGVNVKHSFEPRIRKIREMAHGGELGRLRMIHNWRFVDWLYRPRTEEEITPGWGNGLLWRQGPHQFDIIRTIGGGMMRSVRGMTGVWDAGRRVPGAFTTYFEFEDGLCGTAMCSAYDHFDSRAQVYGFDGTAPLSEPARHARARRELKSHDGSAEWENAAAGAERYGGGRRSTEASKVAGQSGGWILGGPLIASFDKGDVRLSPAGLIVDGDDEQWEIDLTGEGDGRDGRLETFHAAIAEGKSLIADGRWGKATQEVLIAVEESAATGKEVTLSHQVPSVD
jgi:phthalate 4,5-cis-dihydrodiol dehydrogenase